MDPQATIKEIHAALDQADVLLAANLLADLDEWIARGGWRPAGHAEAITRYQTTRNEIEYMINAISV